MALVATVSHFKVDAPTNSDAVLTFRSAKPAPAQGTVRMSSKPPQSRGNTAVAIKPDAAGWEDF